MALKAERKGFSSLQQEEGVEGADRSALVAQENRANVCDKGGRANCVRERNSVVAGVGRGDRRVLSALFPIKLARVYNHAAKGCSVAADKLCGGVNDDVGSALDRANKEGSSKCVVDDNRNSVLVGDLRDGVDVRNVAVGISQSLKVNGLCVGLDRSFDFLKVMGVYKSGLDAELLKRVRKQVVGSAVDCLLGYDVLAGLGQGLDCVGDGGRSRGDGQGGDSAFERGDALFKNVLGAVGQAAVNVSGVCQAKAVGGVL